MDGDPHSPAVQTESGSKQGILALTLSTTTVYERQEEEYNGFDDDAQSAKEDAPKEQFF